MAEQSSHVQSRSRGVLPAWAIVEIDRLRKERQDALEDGRRKAGSRDYWLHVANVHEQQRDEARLEVSMLRELLAYHGYEVQP